MAMDWELMQLLQGFTGSLVEEIQWSWKERERGGGRKGEVLINVKLISFLRCDFEAGIIHVVI